MMGNILKSVPLVRKAIASKKAAKAPTMPLEPPEPSSQPTRRRRRRAGAPATTILNETLGGD